MAEETAEALEATKAPAGSGDEGLAVHLDEVDHAVAVVLVVDITRHLCAGKRKATRVVPRQFGPNQL